SPRRTGPGPAGTEPRPRAGATRTSAPNQSLAHRSGRGGRTARRRRRVGPCRGAGQRVEERLDVVPVPVEGACGAVPPAPVEVLVEDLRDGRAGRPWGRLGDVLRLGVGHQGVERVNDGGRYVPLALRLAGGWGAFGVGAEEVPLAVLVDV